MTHFNAITREKRQLIRQLEELAANAWAAPYAVLHDGWVLRYASGYTRRANSVMPLYRPTQPVAQKLAYCEAFYNQRALPTHFKLTGATEPPDLDTILGEHDYNVLARTSVQMLPLPTWADLPPMHPLDVDTRTYPSAIWLEAFYQMNAVRMVDQIIARQMLGEHLLPPAHFVTLWQKSQPVAVALVVIEKGYAGIFDVVVHPEYRGRGYGRRLMHYLLWLARDQGAHSAYLQVMYDNVPALHLYESLGFREAYQYWYREKPLPVE